MHGEAVLMDMMDGDMVWVLQDIMVDMGRLRNIRKIILIWNNFHFSGFGVDNDTTVINN
jgi:hypothetical protein